MRSAEKELQALCERIHSAKNPRQREELKAEASRIAIEHGLQIDECAYQFCAKPIRGGREAIRFDGDLYCNQRCWADEIRRKRGELNGRVDRESCAAGRASEDQEARSTP